MMTFLALPLVIFVMAFLVGVPVVLIQRAVHRHKQLKVSTPAVDKTPLYRLALFRWTRPTLVAGFGS